MKLTGRPHPPTSGYFIKPYLQTKPMMGVLIAMELVRIYDNMPLMIFVGEVVIQTVFNGFIAMGWTDNIQNIVLGAFLIIVLGVSENMERFTEIRRRQNVRKAASKPV